MARKFEVKTERTARVSQLGKWSSKTKQTWIVLHGYGLLAEYFIKHFEPLNDGARVIIAPEALQRFYLSGTNGRVGASWMTKADRLTDIEDNLNYLDNVYALIPTEHRKNVIVLGFSQGTPTAFRWALSRELDVNHIIAWASDIPADVLENGGVDWLNERNVHVYVGDSDEFVTPERLEAVRKTLASYQLNYQFYTFDGSHRIQRDALKHLKHQVDED